MTNNKLNTLLKQSNLRPSQKFSFYRSLYLYSQKLSSRYKFIKKAIRFLNLGKKIWLISILIDIPKIRKVFVNWHQFILDSFGLIKNGYVVYESRSGMKYKTRANTIDVGILHEVVVSRDYLDTELALQKGDVIIDLGAHIGSFSLLLSSISKNIQIVAIEPQKDNFKLLCDNIRLNSLKNITPVDTAILSSGGKEHFYESEGHKGAHSFFPKSTKGFNEVDIQTTTLRQLFQKFKITKVRLLKIDCEGCEFNILFGFPDEILKKIEEIVLEFHPLDKKRNQNTITSFLQKKGFNNITVSPFPTNIMFCKR